MDELISVGKKNLNIAWILRIIKGYFIFKFDEQFGFFSFLRYLRFITEIKIIHSFFNQTIALQNPIQF